MNELGYIITTLLRVAIAKPVAWFLELLGLYSVAFSFRESVLGIGQSIIDVESSINTGIGTYSQAINQTLDEGSDGLFSVVEAGLNAISGGFGTIAGVGETMANWFSVVDDTIPDAPTVNTPDFVDAAAFGRVQEFIDTIVGGINAIIGFFETVVVTIIQIPGIIFIPVGALIEFIFGGIANFFGAGAGFSAFIGSLTGFEATFILIGTFLLIFTLARAILSLTPNSIVFSPGESLETIADGYITGFTGLAFLVYGITNVPGALMMVGLGTTMFFISQIYNRGLMGIIGIVLMGIGILGTYLGIGLGYVITFLPLAPATFIALLWVVTQLDRNVAPAIESDEALI